MTETDSIRGHADRIIASGVLGRSRIQRRLFDYLIERSLQGTTPKELEIAIDVFGKNADFDVGHDALVRVYIHKLRQRIDSYYDARIEADGQRLTMPRGQYRFSLDTVASPIPKPAADRAPNTRRWLIAALCAALALNAWLLLREPDPSMARDPVTVSNFWAALLDDDLPVTIVLGDYFIFAEMDEAANVKRLIRDFEINSKEDLDQRLLMDPDLMSRYLNVDLNYLPVGSAYALQSVLPILVASGKSVQLRLMSEFNLAEMTSRHVFYVGYISALSKLQELVFASSELAVAGSYDELINRGTGDRYYSEAGILPAEHHNYRDYGLVSTFPGPNGNQVVVVAGMRDEGLMQLARVLTTPGHLDMLDSELQASGIDMSAFEALYEVTGIQRTGLDAMLLLTAPLDYHTIWGGAPLN